MSKSKDAIATVQAKSDLPTYLLEEIETTTVTGFENVEQQDTALSILRILQSNSPVLQDDESLRAGMIYDSATGQGAKEILVTPVGFVGCWMEYVPRDQGGGFAGRHARHSGIELTATVDGYKKFLPNGNELVETAEHAVIVWADTPDLALFPLSSTQLKPSKEWNTDIGRRAKAMYVTKYKLSTTGQKNKKGSWYGLTFAFDSYVSEQELELTRHAAKDYESSLAKATAAYAAAPQTAVVESTVDVSASMA